MTRTFSRVFWKSIEDGMWYAPDRTDRKIYRKRDGRFEVFPDGFFSPTLQGAKDWVEDRIRENRGEFFSPSPWEKNLNTPSSGLDYLPDDFDDEDLENRYEEEMQNSVNPMPFPEWLRTNNYL